jgi:imidazolonepropionase-like amidohydrolase
VLRRRVGVILALIVTAACREPALVTRPPGSPRPTLIRNVWIFDGLAPARIGPRDVMLENGRIRRVAEPGELAARADAHVIQADRFTLLPGLIDVHGHVGNSSLPAWVARFPDPDRNLESYLYCGVTTVLDPADLASDAFTRRAVVARGEKLGPRIFAAGPMFTAPGGHPVAALRLLVPWWLRWYVLPRFTREVATPAAARTAVAALAPERPDVIKVVVDAVPLDGPILPPEVLGAIVDEAHARGIRVVAHVGSVADALEAADAGVDAWMHGVYKERIPDEVIPRFAAAHIPCVATVNVFDSYADLSEGHREPTDLERQTVSRAALAGFVPVPKGYDYPEMQPFFRRLAATREARRDNVRRLHAAGVTILAGADAQTGVFPGPGLHRELAKLVESGLSPAEALRAATGDAARFVARTDDPEFGIVADGKIADLLLVEGDPTTDIGAVSHIRAVFQGGVMLERHPVTR